MRGSPLSGVSTHSRRVATTDDPDCSSPILIAFRQCQVLHCTIRQIRMTSLQRNHVRVHMLVRIDTRSLSEEQGEIRAFMTVRDEMLRLPRTLDHYRRIGVSRFFVTDNGSGDGTKEFLLTQPDCHVFLTHNSYSESVYGVEWQHALLHEYGTKKRCLVADDDEWNIYK